MKGEKGEQRKGTKWSKKETRMKKNPPGNIFRSYRKCFGQEYLRIKNKKT